MFSAFHWSRDAEKSYRIFYDPLYGIIYQIWRKIQIGFDFFENRLQHALHLAEERERVLKIELVQTETARADTLERYKDIKEHSQNCRGQFLEFSDSSQNQYFENSMIRKNN